MTFDDITARVKKISKETMAEVQKMNEVRGLNSQISAEKKKIREMYTEMGKKLYDRYKEEPLEGFESDFHSLDQAFGMIEELQGLIRAAKGVTLCPNCKMEVSVMERFCSNCGCKMPEEYRIEMEEEPVIEDNAQADDAASDEPETSGEAGVEDGETAEDLSETANEAEAVEDVPETEINSVTKDEPEEAGGKAGVEDGSSETAKEAEAAEDSPETVKEFEVAEDSPEMENGAAAKDEPEEAGGNASVEEGLSETVEEAEAAEDSPETAKEAEAAENSPETADEAGMANE